MSPADRAHTESLPGQEAPAKNVGGRPLMPVTISIWDGMNAQAELDSIERDFQAANQALRSGFARARQLRERIRQSTAALERDQKAA